MYTVALPNAVAGFGLGHGNRIQQRRFGMHGAHAAAAAAAGRLDNDRITDFMSHLQVLFGIIGQRFAIAGHAWNAGLQHGFFGGNLVAHHADGIGVRADEHKAALLYFFRKIGIFGQKTIARMDRFGIGYFGGADDGRDIQVAVHGSGRADADGFVGQTHVF